MTSTALRRVRRLIGVLVFAAALGVWEAWARHEASFLVPPASSVLTAAWEEWPTTDFLSSMAASVRRLAIGFLLGAAIGIALGLVLGASNRARRTLEPLVEFARALPPIAIVPAVIVVLGVADAMQVAVIAFGVCFPVLVNTVAGVRAVSAETRDTASMLQVDGAERVLRVYLPAALPSIAAGLRVALSIGVILVVISEFVGEGDGLGHYIELQESRFDLPALYGGILFLGLLGYVLNRLFLLGERRVLAWHFGSADDPAR
jgi:ABC-type nitrate/sulfonate/bicarbonate transport system permease component